MAMDSYYVLSLNILKALGGDVSITYPDADSIWVEINKIYNNAGNRFDIAPLEKIITENGEYNYYPDDNIDAFTPVNINVNVPQKYTDEQVFELRQLAESEGYRRGYDEGEEYGKLTGREEGYTEGFNSGVDAGQTVQKNKLTNITIVENGVYEKEDGYNVVTVEVAGGVTDEEVETLVNAARKEGYRDGYSYGVDDGITYQKNKLGTTTFKDNGNYTSEDGWNNVTVEVDIPEFETEELNVELKENKNYTYTPTTNGFSSVNISVNVPSSGGGDTGKPKIYNGFRFTSGDMATVDFTQYDWSRVYDTLSFFEGTTHSTSDWSNFESGFNGKCYNGNRLFYGCKEITTVPILNTSKVVDMSYMFYNCKNLTTIPQLDTSNVTNMSYMLYYCNNLTTIPQLDTSKVTDMNNMFFGCKSLANIPQLDTSNVTNMSYMFNECNNLTTIPQLDTSKVTDMNNMFTNCFSLTTIPQLDTSKTTSATRMFFGCSSLESLPHLDLSNSTTIKEMFYGCNKLTNISISNTSEIRSLAGVFRDCSSLTTIPQFDTSNVTNMEYTFKGCSSLTTIPQLDYSRVTSFAYTFNYSGVVELPDFNTVNTKNFGAYSYNSWLSYTNKLQKLGAVNCDSATDVNYFFGDSSKTNLTEFGGCINLGAKSSVINTSGSNFMKNAPNLNYQSVLNVLNGLYDRKTAGYSILTLKLHDNHIAMLSDDDIAIATNKGWVIS